MGEPRPAEQRPSRDDQGVDRGAAFRAPLSRKELTFGDPVEEWKRSVHARIADECRSRDRRPAIRLHVTLGFVALAAVVGTIRGRVGWVTTVASLGSVLLVHELSRALFARALGRSSSVLISARGGDTALSGSPLRGVPSLIFTTIGSIANVLVGLSALSIAKHGGEVHAAAFAATLAFAHLVWGGAQLIPIVPFRTGMALSARLRPSYRFVHAAGSLVLVVATGVLGVSSTESPVVFGAFMFAALACAQVVREAYRESYDAHSDLGNLIEHVESALSEGDAERARCLGRQGLDTALSVRQRQRLWKALAWAGIGQRDPFLAHEALLRVHLDAIDLHLLASYLTACNRIDEAIELLQGTRGVGHRSAETTKLLADLLFRRGEYGAVLALARADDALLSVDDLKAIESAVTRSVVSRLA
jgi:hypothetical protein